MNDDRCEKISAFLDDELSATESQRLIDELGGGAGDSTDRLARYRLIGDVLRGECPVLADGMDRRVGAALVEEPTILRPPRRGINILRPVAGVALAASVAAAAIVFAPGMLGPSGDESMPIATTVATAPVAPGMQPTLVSSRSAAAVDARVVRPVTDLEERLNRLVIEHQEFGGRSGLNGPVPHIGLVSYDRR